MAGADGRQIEHSTTNGQRPRLHQNMLHKIRTEGGAGRNAWLDSRPKSASAARYPTAHADEKQKPDSNETSIALVPRNHPLLALPNLEAEASGLLDRLLSVFQDNTM